MRLLTGAGPEQEKSEKSQRKRGRSALTIREPERYVFTSDDFDSKQFEKYYRTILLIKYYIGVFERFNKEQGEQ